MLQNVTKHACMPDLSIDKSGNPDVYSANFTAITQPDPEVSTLLGAIGFDGVVEAPAACRAA